MKIGMKQPNLSPNSDLLGEFFLNPHKRLINFDLRVSESIADLSPRKLI